MNLSSMLKLMITYLTSFCMVAGGLHWAFFFTILNSFTTFDVYASDEIKNKLDQNFNLSTPKNVDGVDLYNKIMDSRTSSNLTNIERKIINTDYGTGQTLDFSGYEQVDFKSEYKNYIDDGMGVKASAPSMTDGNIDAEYYEKGGVKFERDSNNNLVMTTIPESERGSKTTSIKGEEAFTSQQKRSDAEFNAPDNYGNEDDYIDDLRIQHGKTKDGKTMDAEAYRAILKAAKDNPAPKLKPDSYFLDAGNKAIGDARDGNGIWAQTCKDEETTETEIKNIPIWEEKVCGKPNGQNLDFCEVTRTLEIDPENPNKYIEKYVQHPVGCADKVGWEPICPVTHLLVNQSPIMGAQTLLANNRLGGLQNRFFKYFSSPLTISAFAAFVPSEHLIYEDIQEDGTLIVDSIERDVYKPDFLTSSYNGGEGTAHLGFLNEDYEVGELAFSNKGLYTLKSITPRAAGSFKLFYEPVETKGVCDVKQTNSISDGLALTRQAYNFDSLNDPYLLETCHIAVTVLVGTSGASVSVNQACTYKSAACYEPPQDPYECPPYTPEAEVDEFCTFEEWEIVDQGTYNYPQELIKNMPKMFAGDPNSEALYGGDQNGNGQYHASTWKINAKGYSCDPLKGEQYCASVVNPVTNVAEEKCYSFAEFKELKGSCEIYENSDKCELTNQSCTEGWMHPKSNKCFLFSNEYRCDVSNPLEITKKTKTNVCSGMLPCIGDDCDIGEQEGSDDFEEAVLKASIAQHVADDSNCVSTDPDTCEIFPGEKEYCSWEVSGVGNNCCEAPSGINYIEIAATTYKMMQTETFKNVSSELAGKLSNSVTDKVGGLYTEYSQMLVDGWNAGSKAVVDFASSAMGDPEFMKGVADGVQLGQTTAKKATEGVMYSMQQGLYNFMNDLLPDALSNLLFEEAGQQAIDAGAAEAGDLVLTSGAEQILSIISFVGLIYTIYNVAKLLANLLTQCDDNEQDMGVKIAQKQCFKVDKSFCAKKVLGICYLKRQNWCCYSSMLARIIGDQGSKQLSKDMSSCPGFTVNEFASIDFSQLDLSEWLSTMYESDIISKNGYDIERLTGTGRYLGNLSCEGSDDPECEELVRKNAEIRAGSMFDGDVSETADEVKDTLDPDKIDCSIYPRPLICEINN